MLHLCSHCYHGDRLAGYGIDDQRHSYHDYRHDNQDVHNFPAGFFLENKKMLQLSIIFHNEFLYNNSVRSSAFEGFLLSNFYLYKSAF